MKKAIYLISCLAFVGCTSNSVKIEEVKIKPIEFKDICFKIEESSYPQIKGLKDEILQQEFNQILNDNYNNYIKSAKKNAGSCEDLENSLNMDDYPYAQSSFLVLSNDGNIISIVQKFTNCPGGGGNECMSESKVINFDIKQRKVLNNSDFIKRTDMDKINKQWNEYFVKMYPESASYLNKYVSDPFTGSKVTYDKLNFGLRNDSVMLVIEAQPEAHYTYGTYVIPIDKWHR